MLLSYTYEPMKYGSNIREPEQTKANFFRVFGKDCEGNNVLHLCGLNRMPEIHKMLRESEFMRPYRKNKTFTLRSRRQTNDDRLRRLRKEAHRLNRKGFPPSRLNYESKAADSFEDTDAKEEDMNEKDQTFDNNMTHINQEKRMSMKKQF